MSAPPPVPVGTGVPVVTGTGVLVSPGAPPGVGDDAGTPVGDPEATGVGDPEVGAGQAVRTGAAVHRRVGLGVGVRVAVQVGVGVATAGTARETPGITAMTARPPVRRPAIRKATEPAVWSEGMPAGRRSDTAPGAFQNRRSTRGMERILPPSSEPLPTADAEEAAGQHLEPP